MNHALKLLPAAIMMANAGTLYADDRFSINGFMSAGVAIGSEEVEYQSGFLKIDDKANFRSDNILAIQMRFVIDDKTSVTTQLVSKGLQGYKPDTEWAYISYQATDDLTLRAGKLRSALYMHSEDLEVGMAYPWVRPPVEIYNVPLTYFTGVDARYTFDIGPVSNAIGVYVGEDDVDTNPPYLTIGIKLRDRHGMNLTSSWDSLSFRIGVNQADLKLDLDSNSGFNGLNTALVGVGSEHHMSDYIDVSYGDFGITYDDGSWFATAEIAELRWGSTVLNGNVGSYFTFGKRVGSFMPYITLSKSYTAARDDKRRREASASLSGAANGLNTLATVLSGTTTTYAGSAGGAGPEAVVSGTLAALGSTMAAVQTAWVGTAALTDDKAVLSSILTTARSTLLSNASGLAAAAEGIDDMTQQNDAATLGIRFDATPRVAMKFEATRVGNMDGTAGPFATPVDDGAMIYSFVVDAMF